MFWVERFMYTFSSVMVGKHVFIPFGAGSEKEKDIAGTEEGFSPVVAAFLLWFGRDVIGEHLPMQLHSEDFGKKIEFFKLFGPLSPDSRAPSLAARDKIQVKLLKQKDFQADLDRFSWIHPGRIEVKNLLVPCFFVPGADAWG